MIISEEKTKIKSADDLYDVMKNIYSLVPEEDKHKELAYCIGLNSQNIISYIDLVAIGTVNFAIPSKRECLRLAIVKNAVSIVFIHNHPSSGNCNPSIQDDKFTDELKRACELVEIKLLDHIILGEKSYFSYAEKEKV